MLATPDAFPGPVPLAQRSGRIGLGAFSGLLVIGLLTQTGEDPARLATGVIVALAGAVPLFLVRPRFGIGYAAVAAAGVVVLGNADSRDVVWFGVIILAAWCVLFSGVALGTVYGVAIVLLFGGEWRWAQRDPGWGPWTAGLIVSVLAALLIRHEFVLLERLRAAQADLAERSRAEERNHIARELHDVIAHGLTVSLLHITSARLAVEHDPADAARALAEAERLGRQSLAEVRATMGLLRANPNTGVAPPAPHLDQVPALVDQLRQAGAAIDLAIDADLDALPATTGSTLYRIVQEALTNAVKHAPGAPVSVCVSSTRRGVDLSVDSAGAPGQGTGMGVEGMRERARAVGGMCTAGPGGSGWLVHATLPHEADWSPGSR